MNKLFNAILSIHALLSKAANIPAGIYLLKINKENTLNEVWNLLKVNSKFTRIALIDAVLVELLLILKQISILIEWNSLWQKNLILRCYSELFSKGFCSIFATYIRNLIII